MTVSETTTGRRQIAWVYDLNKCIGCQTCSVACKVLWTRDEGEKHQWWMSVNTMPGLTSYSRYPRMMAAAGLSLADVIDRLVSVTLTGKPR